MQLKAQVKAFLNVFCCCCFFVRLFVSLLFLLFVLAFCFLSLSWVLSFVCLFNFFFFSVEFSGCLPSWHRVGNRCFQLHLYSYTTWAEALIACDKQSASLAAIEDKSVMQELQVLLNQYEESPVHLYIGSRAKQEADWHWLDKSLVISSAWGPGEPSGDGQCGSILRAYNWKDWALNDLPCTYKLGYICKSTKGVSFVTIVYGCILFHIFNYNIHTNILK